MYSDVPVKQGAKERITSCSLSPGFHDAPDLRKAANHLRTVLVCHLEGSRALASVSQVRRA